MRNRAYCMNCDRMVLIDLVAAGDRAIEVCGACDNAVLYDTPREYYESERWSLRRMRNCDHSFGSEATAIPEGICEYCGLPEDEDPEDLVDSRATGWKWGAP